MIRYAAQNTLESFNQHDFQVGLVIRYSLPSARRPSAAPMRCEEPRPDSAEDNILLRKSKMTLTRQGRLRIDGHLTRFLAFKWPQPGLIWPRQPTLDRTMTRSHTQFSTQALAPIAVKSGFPKTSPKRSMSHTKLDNDYLIWKIWSSTAYSPATSRPLKMALLTRALSVLLLPHVLCSRRQLSRRLCNPDIHQLPTLS